MNIEDHAIALADELFAMQRAKVVHVLGTGSFLDGGGEEHPFYAVIPEVCGDYLTTLWNDAPTHQFFASEEGKAAADRVCAALNAIHDFSEAREAPTLPAES